MKKGTSKPTHHLLHPHQITHACNDIYIHTHTHTLITSPKPPNSHSMPSLMDPPVLMTLLRQSKETNTVTSTGKRQKKGSGVTGVGILKMFKLLPMLTTGCKVAQLLNKSTKALLSDTPTTTITLFGYRRSKASLAIQEDPRSSPVFLIELPMHTSYLHKEMSSGLVKIALESETRSNKKKLREEHVWAVYCNGRKSGYSIRRREASDEERYVMSMLRWVSVGAGVLPGPAEGETTTAAAVADSELTYIRARFEKVVGSKDSEALYMINPDGSAAGAAGPELSIFLVRKK
ncbi:Protein MIZU-KUSSEI 1-like plant protein [Dioscorea alata]|uniref:Protein MIZU-KUSSEI 1-like plant protein n=1 Tax=Dioscorea alata TaxID=55571 RepID=A0ACB7U2U1_DIOAL|nr:Protein MIZU-KUSSEI 1-like plant protein [Dioscorea alata]